MRRDSRLSGVLHVLLHMAEHPHPITSEMLARAMGTNPVVIRRLMAGLRQRGFVRSEKGHGGGWTIACDLRTVTLLDGPNPVGVATITGGVATMTLPARSLPVGLHTLAAVYSGDDNLNATAITVPVTVTKASSSMTAKVAPKNPKAGKKVKLKITVTGDNGVVPTGKVVVKVNGKKVTVTLKNGKAKATLGTFPKGTYKAKVSYAGDASVSGSKVKVTIQVT